MAMSWEPDNTDAALGKGHSAYPELIFVDRILLLG